MAIGQAAGVASALAARKRCDVRAVPLAEVKVGLCAVGAIVPGPVEGLTAERALGVTLDSVGLCR